MPTSMMVSSLRLLFVLLLSCALCFNAQVLNNFYNFNDTLPVDGSVFVIPHSVSITNHPGPLTVLLSAGFSVEMCITPNAAISNNLLFNCPKNSYYNFDYYYNLTIPPINLFLDDFSMNFRGQYLTTNGSAPYTNLTTHFSLLQNVDYFISLSFGPTYLPPNSTFANFWLYLFENNQTCSPGLTVPSKTGCVPITGTVTPQITSYNIRSLTALSPAIVAFQIQNLTTSVVINLAGTYPNDTIEDLVVSIAYNADPTTESAQYSFATISTEYIVSPNQNQSFTLMNPLIGNYYAQIKSLQTDNRDITFSYIPPTACSIPTTTTGSCGSTNFTILGEDVDTLELTSTWTYYAVSDVSTLLFGVQLTESFNGTYNGTFSVLIGNNYFPSPDTLKTGIGKIYTPVNGTFFANFSNPLDDNTNYFIAVSGTLGQSAIVWQGAQCPENCNGHGTCNANYVCVCDDDYSGEYCQDHSGKKLSTLYIILIIIGGAIVLAVLIGVPVALYLNNRKRARYERV